MDIQNALAFLEQVDANNSKLWMDKHRSEWHEVRDWWIDVVSQITEKALEYDPDLWTLNPRKSITRINSDIRFSKNKRIYKTYLGARFNPESAVKADSGYYIDFGIKRELAIYCGAMAYSDRLWQKAIRKKLELYGSVLEEILDEKELQKYFPKGMMNAKLTRPPRGYEKDHQYIEYIKYKYWGLGKKISIDDSFSLDEFIDTVVDHIRVTSDFVRYFRMRNLPLVVEE